MNENRSFASLGPTLLARKGGARPAMRPQLGMTPMGATALAQSLDDLGWNDMGHDEPDAAPAEPQSFAAEVVSIHAEPAAVVAELPAAPAVDMPEPAVKQQLRAIAEHMERQDRKERAASQPKAKPVRRPATAQGRRAAFTLRLDDERHLKLRLACTVQNRSAQMLLIDILDDYLAQTPDIEALAAQVKRS